MMIMDERPSTSTITYYEALITAFSSTLDFSALSFNDSFH